VAKTVLIVDDDAEMLYYCSYLLASYGYLVDTAADGTQARAILKSKAFDLVLTDHVTVGMKATPILEEVRTVQPEADMIVMSGIPTLKDAATSYLAGARAYLEKPFSIGQLQEALDQCPRLAQ